MIVLASGLAVGGNWYLVKHDPNDAVDRFTGEDAAKMELRWQKELSEMELKIESLRGDVKSLDSRVRGFESGANR